MIRPQDRPFTPQEALREAAYLLERYGLCQGMSACDTQGVQVLPTDPSAVRFCVLGALSRVVTQKLGSLHLDPASDVYYTACRAVLDAVPDNQCITRWNDAEGRTTADAASLLRKATKIARPPRS